MRFVEKFDYKKHVIEEVSKVRKQNKVEKISGQNTLGLIFLEEPEFLEGFNSLIENEEFTDASHITEKDTDIAREGYNAVREELGKIVREKSNDTHDFLSSLHNDVTQQLLKTTDAATMLRNTQAFREGCHKLYSSKAYYEYLYFAAMVAERARYYEKKQAQLVKEKKELQEQYDRLPKKPNIWNRFTDFVAGKQNPLLVEFERRDKKYEDERTAFIEEYDAFKKHCDEFKKSSEDFPKTIVDKTAISAMPKEFKLPSDTREFFELKCPQAKSLREGIFGKTVADTSSKTATRLVKPGLMQEWEKSGKYSQYSSQALVEYKENIKAAKEGLGMMQEHFRAETQPQGFFEKVRYFLKRKNPFRSNEIPADIIETTHQYFKKYEGNLEEEEYAVLEAMLARLEAASSANDLSFDDVSLAQYQKLQLLGVEPYKIMLTNGSVGINKGNSGAGKGLHIVASQNLTPELIREFFSQIQNYAKAHAAIDDNNFSKAQDLLKRMNNVVLFKRPAQWLSLEFNSKTAKRLGNDPRILMELNALSKKLQETDAIELWPLENINELGQFTYLESLRNQIENFDKYFQEKYYKHKTFLTGTVARDMINYVRNEIDEFNKSYKRKVDKLVRITENAVIEEMDKLINSNIVFSPEYLNELNIKLKNAIIFLVRAKGKDSYLRGTNVLFHLMESMASCWRPDEIYYQNISNMIDLFLESDTQKSAFKAILNLTYIINIPTEEKEIFNLQAKIASSLNVPLERAGQLLTTIAEKRLLPYVFENVAEIIKTQSELTVQEIDIKVKYLQDYTPFIKFYTGSSYQAALESLQADVKSYDGSDVNKLLEIVLLEDRNSLINYAEKRFDYLLRNRNNSNGRFTNIDRWFFNTQLDKNPNLLTRIQTKLTETLEAKAEFKGDDANVKNEELVNLVMAFGSHKLMAHVHAKIITAIFSNKELGRAGKAIIKYYIEALEKNFQIYNFDEQICFAVKTSSADLLEKLVIGNKDLFDKNNEVIFEILEPRGFVRSTTCQRFRTDCLLDKIAASYDSYRRGDISAELSELEAKYGENGVSEIITALHDHMKIKLENNQVPNISMPLINLAHDLLTPEIIEKYPKAQALSTFIGRIAHERQVDLIVPAVIDAILELIIKQDYARAMAVYKAVDKGDYRTTFINLESKTSFRRNLQLENTEAFENLAVKLTENERLYKKSTQLRTLIMEKVQPKLQEIVKELAIVENVDLFIQSPSIDLKAPAQTPNKADDLNNVLDRIKRMFTDLNDNVVSEQSTAELQEVTVSHQTQLEQKVSKAKLLKEFVQDLAGNQPNEIFADIIKSIDAFIEDKHKLYVELSRALSAADELEEGHESDYVNYITKDNARFIRDYFDPWSQRAIADKIEGKINRALEKRVQALSKQAETSTVAMPFTDKPTIVSLNAFKHLILNDLQSEEDRLKGEKLVVLFPSFHRINKIIVQLIQDPLVYAQQQIALDQNSLQIFSDMRSAIKDNVLSSSLKYAFNIFMKHLDAQLDYLIEVKADKPLLELAQAFGTDAQIKAAQTIAKANMPAQKFIDCLKNMPAEDELTLEMIAKLVRELKMEQATPAYSRVLNEQLERTLHKLVEQKQWDKLEILKEGVWEHKGYSDLVDKFVSDLLVAYTKQIKILLNAYSAKVNTADINSLSNEIAAMLGFINTFGEEEHKRLLTALTDKLLYRYLAINGKLEKDSTSYPGSFFIEEVLRAAYKALEKTREQQDWLEEKIFKLSADHPSLFADRLEAIKRDPSQHPFISNYENELLFTQQLRSDMDSMLDYLESKHSISRNICMTLIAKLAEYEIYDKNKFNERSQLLALTPEEKKLLIVVNMYSDLTQDKHVTKEQARTQSEARSILFIGAVMEHANSNLTEQDNSESNIAKQKENINAIRKQEQFHYQTKDKFHKFISPDDKVRAEAKKELARELSASSTLTYAAIFK